MTEYKEIAHPVKRSWKSDTAKDFIHDEFLTAGRILKGTALLGGAFIAGAVNTGSTMIGFGAFTIAAMNPFLLLGLATAYVAGAAIQYFMAKDVMDKMDVNFAHAQNQRSDIGDVTYLAKQKNGARALLPALAPWT